jgi:Tfp pilus assembly protein PilF
LSRTTTLASIALRPTGQKQLAADSYKKSLEKDPNNDRAREKLKDLEGSPTAAK